MEMVKFGIIGLLILLPFIFLDSVKSEKVYYENLTSDFLELQLDEALSDAAFAMKTYSLSSFDGNRVYDIEIPYDQVIEVFFSSLDYRDFDYSYKDFPVILFVGYDSLIAYVPDKSSFSPEIPYCLNKGGHVSYFNLSDVTDSGIEDKLKNEFQAALSGQVQNLLNQVLWQSRNSNNLSVKVPIYEDGVRLVMDDLSMTVIYQGTHYAGLGLTDYMDVKPAGVMKMKEIIAY